jgi:hypothetical protein
LIIFTDFQTAAKYNSLAQITGELRIFAAVLETFALLMRLDFAMI